LQLGSGPKPKVQQSKNPFRSIVTARLAQSVERQTLNLVVAGSSPAVGCSQKERQYIFAFYSGYLSSAIFLGWNFSRCTHSSSKLDHLRCGFAQASFFELGNQKVHVTRYATSNMIQFSIATSIN
jgi:hypothetical protein